MKKNFFCLITIILSTLTIAGQSISDYPLTPVGFTNVQITDNFWRPRIETNTNVTIPHSFNKCKEDGRIDNFIFAAGIKDGKWRGNWGFDDSDVYKVLEGASFTYHFNKDEQLRLYMDTLIHYIGAAQQPDGYLYTPVTLRANDYTKAYCTYKKERYDNLWESHEFYNMGHMYEAAVAHYLATGQRNFLNIAIKNADHIYDSFGPGKTEDLSGHQEIEIGLVKLYRVTKNPKYLELAKLLLDRRGKSLSLQSTHNQDHKSVIEQDEAVGHAVRANYMYTAMADIAALTGDKNYIKAIDKLWENVVTSKLYLTGGMGALYDGEAYAGNYQLPNISYAETCAAIAGVYWNHRMFLLHGKSKYIDVMERILYNGLISGISLDGTQFFYPNVLYSDGKFDFNKGSATRSEWFSCSCCPTNSVRFMSSISGYIFATHENELYINLYMSNKSDIRLGKINVHIEQETQYPWTGNIQTVISPSKSSEFSVNFRIPGWAINQPVPSDLYTYSEEEESINPKIKVNGNAVIYKMENGYAIINRKWKKGDVVELELPMKVKKVTANKNVEANHGRMALEYGPIVYCFEEVDNGNINRIMLDQNGNYSPEFKPDLLGGITVLAGNAQVLTINKNKVFNETHPVKAIPYYAWNHRGKNKMAVWMPYQINDVEIQP